MRVNEFTAKTLPCLACQAARRVIAGLRIGGATSEGSGSV